LTGALALALGLGFSGTKFGNHADGLFLDTVAPLLGSTREANDLLVILISEKDYSAARTPLALWGTYLIPLLENIETARPEAIGLDMILPQFPLARIVKEHDRIVFKGLKRISKSCRLVSGYAIASNGRIKEPFVFYQKILGLDGYGFLNLTPDPDGVCRKQTLTLPTNKRGKNLYSFSWLLSGLKGEPPEEIMPDWRHPARIKTLSFGEAIETNPSIFNGKVIIIGVGFEFEDRHRSPASGKEEAGAVFHARVVEALKSGKGLLAPAWPYSLLGPAALVVFLMLILCQKVSQRKVIITGIVILAGLAALMVGGLAAGVVLRPSAAVVGLVVTGSVRLFQGYFSVKETFGRYVSREVRDEILSGRIPLDGELKEVSVLFADLRDFTPMVEATPPKEVVKIMNGYFKEMAEAIKEHGGLVLHYIGDEILAVFGAPVPVKDHARLAVKGALEMRRRLEVVNQRLAQQGHTPLRNGIGIHTGEVLAGNIGGGDRLTYTLMGDTVNLASRLQGLNKKFGTDMIISGDTLARIGKEVQVQQLPATPIKGKSKAVDIFSVL
jgi:class 3 adenylate cyclase/CHASE2 domain-containing sensor protein